jgi:hypothetical protein
MSNVLSFFHDQSGGRAEIEYRILNWVNLPYSEQEWVDLGFNAGPTITPIVEQRLNVSLSPFDAIILLIDTPNSHEGVVAADRKHIHISASSFSPSLVSHHLAFLFAGMIADRLDGDRTVIGGDSYCIMGESAYRRAYIDHDLALWFLGRVAGEAETHAKCGPGFSVPNLIARGWFDFSYGINVPRSDSEPVSVTEMTLWPLQGAPLPSQNVKVCAFLTSIADPHELITVEFRRGTIPGGHWDGHWDRALPARSIVIHSANFLGPRPFCLQIGELSFVDNAESRPSIFVERAGYLLTVARIGEDWFGDYWIGLEFEPRVEVPHWTHLKDIEGGDDMGMLPLGGVFGLIVEITNLQAEPGYDDEEIVSISPAAGSLVRRNTTVYVTVNRN